MLLLPQIGSQFSEKVSPFSWVQKLTEVYYGGHSYFWTATKFAAEEKNKSQPMLSLTLTRMNISLAWEI